MTYMRIDETRKTVYLFLSRTYYKYTISYPSQTDMFPHIAISTTEAVISKHHYIFIYSTPHKESPDLSFQFPSLSLLSLLLSVH